MSYDAFCNDVRCYLLHRVDTACAFPPKVTSTDMINSPPHYIGVPVIGVVRNSSGEVVDSHNVEIEAIDVIEGLDLGFHLGAVMKYLFRAGKKGDRLGDLKKARWFLDREIAKSEKD